MLGLGFICISRFGSCFFVPSQIRSLPKWTGKTTVSRTLIENYWSWKKNYGHIFRKESEQRFLSCVPECVSERSLHLARHCG